MGGTGGDFTGSGGVATGGTAGTLVGEAGSPIDATGGTSGSGTVDAAVSQLRRDVTKLDLLFMIDGSIGMAEKQARLAKAIPMLLRRFTHPWCTSAPNPDGAMPVGSADDDGFCAEGLLEFPPIRDIHVGVISSNLGDHGSNDVCSDAQNQVNGGGQFYDDRAQLIPTMRSNLGDQDFLKWDSGSSDVDQFASAAAAQVTAVDEKGCGYEAQLESWYRFLVDPNPVQAMSNDGAANSVRGAVNAVVLQERAAFLRPDSAVMIVMLSDENDCSILDENGTQGWLVGYKGGVSTNVWHMPRATSACDTNPEDPCCRPCGSGVPLPGCPSDDQDSACKQSHELTQPEDSLNLRCFKEKQRFGIDLLYPIARYTSALQSQLIDPRMNGQMVPNPLFAPGADGTPGRDRTQVFLAGIVGVPWQDVAYPQAPGQAIHFYGGNDLATLGRWDAILGDPDNSVPPSDPFMVESIDPRTIGAKNPFVDAAITPSSSTELNAINGHEQDPLDVRDDLQFACIYPREPVLSANDCTMNPDVCDCNADEFAKHSPLCNGVTQFADGSQVYEKAYPALRELQVLKSVGSSGVVTSICPTSTTSTDPATDLGYGLNPALRAVGDALGTVFTPKCLPRSLPLDDANQTTARIYEARKATDCSCLASEGRLELDDTSQTHLAGIEQQLRSAGIDPQGECLCEIAQLDGTAGDSCRNDSSPASELHGFCYLDPSSGLGGASLAAGCAGAQQQRIRFVGDGVPAPNAMTFVVLPYDPTGG